MGMAAAPDDSVGFFSGVWSRLRAAASSRHKKPGPSGGGDDDAAGESEGEEATARSRRVAAARRLGRKLAFVSFNLEVLLFVYAFWKARRRNLNWRQSVQALPMLLIPALATLIYTALVRFTRTLNLKDKETLGRLQEDKHEQNGAKKLNFVDDASNLSSEADSNKISKLGKHDQLSINLRDDHGGDMSWVHSKDLEPINSDDVQRIRFSSQPNNWSSQHLAHDLEDPYHMQMTAHDLEDPYHMQRTMEHHTNSGADVAENGMTYSTVETSSLLPGCGIAHIISNSLNCAECSSPLSSLKTDGGLAEEDAVQILIKLEAKPPAVAELLHEGVEEKESSKFYVSEDNRMSFILEKELLAIPYALKDTDNHLGTSGFTLCNQESEKEDVAGGVCFIKVSPEMRCLSSGLLEEGDEDVTKKESCEQNTQEKNNVIANSEVEASLGLHAVNAVEQFSGTSGFSLHVQCSNLVEVPVLANFLAVSPESNYPAPMESLSAHDEYSKEDDNSDVHVPEQKDEEAYPDSLVVDSYQDSFATSDLLSCNAVAEVTEVLGIVKKGLSESQNERASKHQNDVASSDDSEAHARSSNSYSAENEESLAGHEGGSESKDEMNFAFLDTPILLNEVTCAESQIDNFGYSRCSPDSNRTQSLHEGKQALSKTSEGANFVLEESYIPQDQEISLEIFSLYSRSSSCVSEVNVIETLRADTFPEQENYHYVSFDERKPMMVNDVNHAENYTINASSAEFISEINMMETLNGGKEAISDSKFVNSVKTPHVGNGVGKFDTCQDLLLSPFDPFVFEGSQAAQGFSELQCKNDFTFCKTNVTFREVNNDGGFLTNITEDLKDSKETSINALESAQPGLAKSQDEDFHSIVGSHCFSQFTSPESQSQDPLTFEEAFVYPGEVLVAENSSDNANLPFCTAEVNLIESLDNDQRGTSQQQDKPNLGFEDIYMAHQHATPENHLNNLGYQHTSDSNMMETLQGTERLSPRIFHDGIFCIAGTSISVDGGNNAENSLKDSCHVMSNAQKNTAIVLGLQVGPSEAQDKKAAVSISKCELDRDETNCSECTYAAATMTGATQDVNEEFYDPEHQEGPGLMLNQMGVPCFIDEGEETEKDLGGSSTTSSHHEIRISEALHELPITAGGEKCSPEDTYEELKDLETKGMKEDSEDSDEDREKNSIDFLGAVEAAPSLAQKPYVKLYDKDASSRNLTMGMINGFEAA